MPLALSRAERDAARRLAAAGYATAAFTTTSFLSLRSTGLHGFEVYDSPEGETNVTRPGFEAVAAALGWLREVRRRPVFLWVHLYDAHAPYGDVRDKRLARHVDPRGYGWVERERFEKPEARARMAER